MRSGKKAFTLIYCMVALAALLGMVSLAVDWGRVQTAKTELRNAIDAAARYGSTGIGDGTATAKAILSASENSVDGSPLILQTSDVSVGTWDGVAKSFAAGGSSPNAIQIKGSRVRTRGTAIPLIFGQIVGLSSCDVKATTTIIGPTSSPTYDVVGLSAVTISGAGKIQRWSSEVGTVNVASNGTFSLSYGQYIYGNVLYRGTAPNPPAGCITGTKTAMSSDITFSTPTTPGGSMNVGAASYGNGTTYSVPGGNYSATSLTIGGGCTMNLTGDVNIYCSGAIDIGNGATINTSGTAYKLTIYQTAASTVNINMSAAIYARIYAPLSTVTIGGASPFIGSFVANSVTVSGSASVSYSSALPIPIAGSGGGGGGTGSISMVQ